MRDEEKQEPRIECLHQSHPNVRFKEVRPGDPPDLDALLAAIDAPGHDAALPLGYRTWIQRVKAARSGEGGDK